MSSCVRGAHETLRTSPEGEILVLKTLFYPTLSHISYLWRRRFGPQFRDFPIGSRCERERWTYKKNTVLELTNRGKFRQLPDSCNIPVSEYCSIMLLPVFLSALYKLVWAGVWTADVYLDYMLVAYMEYSFSQPFSLSSVCETGTVSCIAACAGMKLRCHCAIWCTGVFKTDLLLILLSQKCIVSLKFLSIGAAVNMVCAPVSFL